MDDNRIDLKAGLRELAAEEAGGAGPHVGMKRLIAFREGTLAAADRERVEEHLSLCPRCTRLLRELRDFAAAAATGEAGPESLREEAWESLAARLAQETPVARPIAITGPSRARRRAPLVFLAAALLLAILGFVLWTVGAARQERQVARLEQQLRERDASIAALRKSLAEAEQRLAGRGESRDPEKERLARQVVELTAAWAELRAERNRPERREEFARASPDVDVSIAPRFVLRGQPPPGGDFLRAGGAVNTVRLQEERFTVALSLAEHAVFREYRLEVLDRRGNVLWTGRRPPRSLLGDAGTSLSFDGLDPGLYSLRIEGLHADRSEFLVEYLIEVEPSR